MDHIPIEMDEESISAMNNVIGKATKSATAKMNQFKNELKKSQDYLISTQGPMEQEIMKEALKIRADEFEEHYKKYIKNNIFDDKEKDSVSDQKSDMEEHQADKIKNRLKEKYEEALKHDEKLEAEAKRSFNDPDSEVVEHQTELKKRHKDQVDLYKVVQEKLMASFKKDMDKLMIKFEAEYSRLSKAHSELMADTPMQPEMDNTDASSTHQP
ncbi:uncharacterized protein LOC119560759 [Drosophila subpulchrella]|uniref:uncharacterized protein LOC119560759 n=1 Tax=Drosophila subpulchrella TaxID=1486046 RepID=UPI0018A136AA|nr:uncharacterized protein LOC119560759 [Drosophila subpulchrella]